MKKAIIPATLALLIVATLQARPIGLTYEDVMVGLDRYFQMEDSSPVRGEPRVMSKEGSAGILEIIGDLDNIERATVAVGAIYGVGKNPARSRDEQIARQFVANVVGECQQKATTWLRKAVADSAKIEYKQQMLCGDRLLEVEYTPLLGLTSLTVKHRKNYAD